MVPLARHARGFQAVREWCGGPCLLAERRPGREMAGKRIRKVWHASCFPSNTEPDVGFKVP